jgi:hypothetical protein
MPDIMKQIPYLMIVLAGKRDERSGVRITLRARDFSLLPNVQTGSEAHPTSYSMCTGLLSQG